MLSKLASYDSPQAMARLIEQGDAGLDKLAAAGSAYIRTKLREEGFFRRVIQPVKVTRDDPDVNKSENHDTLVMIKEIEPDSSAFSINFRGEVEQQMIRGERLSMAFHSIESIEFFKTTQELLAYDMPITKILENNIVKDIEAVEDRTFLVYAETGIQVLQTNAYAQPFNRTELSTGAIKSYTMCKSELALTGTITDNMDVTYIQKGDVFTLAQSYTKHQIKMEKVLIHQDDWLNYGRQTAIELGDSTAAEIAVNGYTYNKLAGYKTIRTIKDSILRQGNMYGFATSGDEGGDNFLGYFGVLEPVTMWTERRRGRNIHFGAWETICAGLMARGCRKMEFYQGSVVTQGGQTPDANYTDRIPMSEEAMFETKDLEHYPEVKQY